MSRLDLRRKELVKEKEALLKESKAKLATMESVKSHIDTLMKVRWMCSARTYRKLICCALQTATEVQKKVHDLVEPIPTASESPSPPVPS